MVDVSGATPIETTAMPRIASATPVAQTQPVSPVSIGVETPAAGPDLAQTSGLAQSLAASPPVDADRVATIKKAIAEGRFPILPATIADRLIALKLAWSPNDEG